MLFADRGDAGRQLAAKLWHVRGEAVVVLGVPRGGVPVAFEVARALDAPLDVIVVPKVGVPCGPEPVRGDRSTVSIEGRTVVVVDHGVATGSAARAACKAARVRGAKRVVLAVPVAPVDWIHRIGCAVDEYVCLGTPEPFDTIGRYYSAFPLVSEQQVVECLQRAGQRVTTTAGQRPDRSMSS